MSEDELLRLRRKAALRDHLKDVVLPAVHHRLVGAAEAGHCLHESVEHRLEVNGGVADDLEHVGGRRLLLEGFLQIAALGLYVMEQPRVLDSNDGLSGEIFE